MMTPADYLSLWDTCELTSDPRKVKVLKHVSEVVLIHGAIYRMVSYSSRVPWPIIAALHFRESDQNFSCHLHNGDPLTAKTVHVPANRPVIGYPPFTWQTSAVDALSLPWRPHQWDIAGCLEFLERYNGRGYQKHSVNTPYLWDFTDKYVSGLYKADGVFSPSATESRPGCVAILKLIQSSGVSFDFSKLAGNLSVH